MTTPQMPQILERVALTVLAERCQTMPARVERYDSTTGRAMVQPALKIALGDVDGDGELDYDTLPVLDVPVWQLRAGDLVVHVPLAPGDWVLLVVACRSLDEWWERGEVVEPQDLRVLTLQDAVALPGLYPSTAPLSADAARAGELILGTVDGATQVRIKPGEIIVTAPTVRLGTPGASDPVALSSSVQTELAKIATAITTISAQLIALSQPGVAYVPGGVAATRVAAV